MAHEEIKEELKAENSEEYEEPRYGSELSGITENNISENDYNVPNGLQIKTEKVILSTFIVENEIQTRPPDDSHEWKSAYIEAAKSLWKPLNQVRKDTKSLVPIEFNSRNSEKLVNDKGSGKFWQE